MNKLENKKEEIRAVVDYYFSVAFKIRGEKKGDLAGERTEMLENLEHAIDTYLADYEEEDAKYFINMLVDNLCGFDEYDKDVSVYWVAEGPNKVERDKAREACMSDVIAILRTKFIEKGEKENNGDDGSVESITGETAAGIEGATS